MQSLSGVRVLVVEDEFAVLLLLEDMLNELGCELAGTATRLPEAVTMAASAECDAAVLDVNINGENVAPAAEALFGRGIPVVFSTGYGRSGIDPRWRDLPVRLRLLLDVPPLPAGDWAALRPGDVLVVGPRDAPLHLQARGAGRAWPLAATARGWRIEGVAQPLSSPLSRVEETGAMSEQETAATAAPEDPDAGIRPLPVRVSFEVGALDLRVGELAELQPGYVFALPAHLEGANVVLRANGEAVGQGELVAVGDTLGVRLIAWT